MFGTAGGLIEYKASLLATHGFATLALAYFRYDDLPKTADHGDLDIEYFEEAVEWLYKHPKVQPGGVGIHAISRGSEIALSLAAVCDKVSAVVAIGTPKGYSGASVSYQGETPKPLSIDRNLVICDENDVHWCRNCFNDFSDEREFKVENIKGELLLVVGEDDQILDPLMHRDAIVGRCVRHGKPIKVLSYPGTGHLIEPPYAPPCFMSFHTTLGRYVSWGGTTVEHAYAQEDYWKHAIKFLKACVPRKSKL